MANQIIYAPGDRVQLSAAGLKASRLIARTKPKRVGTVLRTTWQSTVVVHWDGNKVPDGNGLHPSFLKPAEFAPKKDAAE